MKWKSGLLTFHVGKEMPPPNPKRPIGAILMEAVQLNATGPTPPQLVAKMAAARAAMQRERRSYRRVPRSRREALPSYPRHLGRSKTPAGALTQTSSLPKGPPNLPKPPAQTKVAPPPAKAKTPPDPKKQ